MSNLTLLPTRSETIEGASEDLHAGRIDCVGLFERCLARIEQWEPTVKAWVVVDREGARRQAEILDVELQAGKSRGPLHGIPVGIKDIIDVQGLPTRAGSRRWGLQPADNDAPLVTNLRQNGAVILGKTVTTAYAWIDPPPTRNPWNTSRTPGGSSSGSAAAVATGMCLGAIGTQTGGSIIRPASFCGVAGLKPSFQTISTNGIVKFSPSLDTPGPIARTTVDLAILLQALRPRSQVILDMVKNAAIRAPKFTRLRGVFEDRAEFEVRQAVDSVLKILERAGATVVDSEPPAGFDTLHRDHRAIMSAEAARVHEMRYGTTPDDYPSKIRALIEEGSSLRAPRYIQAREHLETIRAESRFYRPGDAFIMPSTTEPAPDLTTTGDPVLNSPWTYVGLPAVTIPIGLSHDGMPLGLQLVGTFANDPHALAVAHWCERVIRGTHYVNDRPAPEESDVRS